MTTLTTTFTTKIKQYFRFAERKATFRKEIIGGLSTFMAMAYILAVNPSILSGAGNGAGGEYAGVFFLGTAISAMVSTLAMGLYANVPIALAPGMGINAFFAYTVASNMLGLSIAQALVCTFISGLLYLFVAVSPLRVYLARLLPKNVKLAIGAMIGLFLAYIGLVDSGIIVSGATRIEIPGAAIQTITTATRLGNFKDPFVIIALVTMLLAFVLHFAKVRGAALIAMVGGVIMLAIAFAAKVPDASKAFSLQTYNSFGKFGSLSKDMWTSFGSALSNGKAYIAIFVFLYVDFFDTTGTLFAIEEQAKLSKTGDQNWMKKANVVDAGATIFGSIMLTSTNTSFVESSVGVSQGARTGFSSLIVGSLFGLAIAAWPVLTPLLPIQHVQAGVEFQASTIMPVTGPILVMVGALMITQLKIFEWKQALDVPTLFVTLVVGMLSYSISSGIAAGVVTYYLVNVGALIITYFRERRGKHVDLNDEDYIDELVDTKAAHQNAMQRLKKHVLNPVMISMLVLAITYFATYPLYAY